jgi:Mg-chelatase subunit ChlD
MVVDRGSHRVRRSDNTGVTIHPSKGTPAMPSPRTHFYVLLDRSGSMESMRTDVIGGFNNLVAEQQAVGPDARLTLVQFDSHDPHEVLTDAVPIHRARALTQRTFVPRGSTPLLDATGRIITKAAVREDQRRTVHKRPEVVTVITITDGLENQSHEFTRADIVRLVKDKEAGGWSFVFLGAGLDAYAEAGGMGYDSRSVQAYARDGAGARLAFRSVSAAMVDKRRMVRDGIDYDRSDYFGGSKEAEDDRNRRHN